jgi:hypothetical protein
VAGDRTHIGTYVGVSPPPASNGNNFFYLSKNYFLFSFLKVIHSFTKKALYYVLICGIIKIVQSSKYFGRFIAN